MARERVQVQGLGDVAPGIQPTIQRAGQYGIQVQRAGRNKLMDLADALSQVNPTLQQYAGLADQEAQLFEEELAQKSPEEVQAMLKQTEGELDKQVRRGAMGWLTSPLNQKRKMQAVGALLHDDYERQLKAQVQDPANADADINELIAGVKDNLRNQYGSLQSAFVNEGFEGTIRETTRRYTLAHDSIATEQARKQLYRAGKNVLFNSAILVKDEVTGNTRMADADLLNQWYEENQGALTPAELLNLRKEVSLELAQRDPDSARNFLNYTGGFKVGTSKMSEAMGVKGEDVFSMYGAEEADIYEDIDKIELADQTKNVHDARQELAVIDELAVDIGMAIKEKKVFVTEEGEQISTEKQAKTYLLNKLQQSDNILVRGSDGVKTVQNALKLLETEPDNFIQFFNKIRNAGLDTIFNQRITQSTEVILRQHLIEDPSKMGDPTAAKIINPIFKQYATEITFELLEERRQKIRELSSGSYLNVNGEEVNSTAWDSEVMEDQARWDRNFNEQFRSRLNDRIAAHNKKIADELAAQNEAKRRGEVISGVKSFVEPGKVLSEITSAIGNTWGNLETKLRGGYNKAAASIADEFETNKQVIPTTQSQLRLPTVPIMRDPFETRESKVVKMTRLEHALSLVQSTSTTAEQKKAANNKIAMYLMAKGPQYYTAENIRKGSVDISIGATPETTRLMPVKQAQRQGFEIIDRTGFAGVGALVKVPAVEGITHNIKIDKEALKRLIGLYPLISEERLNAIKAGVESYEPEKELYEALFDVTLTEGDEGDEKTLREFIDANTKLLNKFKK